MKTIDMLFVEDKPEQVSAIRDAIPYLEEKYGTKIDVAKTYADYEKKTQGKEYDVVLTDLFIPFSDDKNSPSQGKALYKELFDEIKTGIKTKDGKIQNVLSQDSDCMTGMRTLYDRHEHKRFDLVPESFTSMHASNTLGEYVDGATIDDTLLNHIINHSKSDKIKQIIKSKKKNDNEPAYYARKRLIEAHDKDFFSALPKPGETGPFGVKIFLKEYFEKGHTTKMITNDHAHSSEGSPFMMYLQHKGLAKYGRMPFVYLGESDDLRLTADAQKPQTKKDLEKEVVQALFMHKLKDVVKSDEEFMAADTARKYLESVSGISVEDLYFEKAKFSEDTIKRQLLEKLQSKYDRTKKEYPDGDYCIKYMEQKKELESGKISIYDFPDGRFREKEYAIQDQIDDIKKGMQIIKKTYKSTI